MITVRILLPIAVSGLLLACTAPKRVGTPPEDPAALEDAAAKRGLRRMFPGVRGEMTRESIAAELAREAEERDPAGGVRSEAVRAIQAGEFDRARDLLGELLAADLVERARAATAAGDARGALVALDHALEVAPRSPSILCARGEAVLALPAGERDAKLLEGARANFLAAVALDTGPNLARAWLGASRASRGLGRLPDACDHARRGIAASSAASSEANFGDPLRRALAEAEFDGYAVARAAAAPADAISHHARATRDSLEDLLGRTPEEPWTWARLAELAESERAPAEARDLAARGLRIAPDDPALLQRLSLAARAIGGPAAAVEAFERVCRDHPDVAPAARELGRAFYDAAIEDSRKGRDPGPKLVAAEAAALHARRLALEAPADAALAESSGNLAAQCRGALGLWKLAKDDLAGAHTAFLSMEDARKGGLALDIPSTGSRGTDGLFRVATAFGARGGEVDGLVQAAKICDLLREVDPTDARFAASAGTFNEEAAIQLELQSRAAQKKPADAERLLARAREAMEAANLALADAVRLAPEDERVLARAGEVLGRYLQRDAPAAIAHLEKAVELGDAKLPKLRERAAEAGLADAERQARRKLLDDAETLVGDAAENLGRVHLKLVGNAARAREWLERSRRTGADPRPGIDELIAQCDDAIAKRTDPRVKNENRWAAPAPHGRTP